VVEANDAGFQLYFHIHILAHRVATSHSTILAKTEARETMVLRKASWLMSTNNKCNQSLNKQNLLAKSVA
jgi:hypothetical protein